ncbi:MAG: hypothetical protein WAN04_04720 [Candidatus Udaeobacter sp.]
MNRGIHLQLWMSIFLLVRLAPILYAAYGIITDAEAAGSASLCDGLIAVRSGQRICGRRIRRWRGKRGPNRSSGEGREFSLTAR